MQCVVFGGGGFIGSHLVDKLVASGHRVTVLDRQPNPFVGRRTESRFIRGDFSDTACLEDALRGANVAYHLIGTTVPQTSNESLPFDFKTNVLWTINLLQACAKAAIGKVVFLSSGGTVYGIPQIVPIPETHPTDPICSYGLTKLVVEKYLGLFRHLQGLDYTVLRCSNAYGERQNPFGRQGAVAVFLGRIARDEPLEIWGNGGIVRDYVYVQDIVRALELAGCAQIDQPVVNIGSGVGVSLRELIEAIHDVTGRGPKVEYHAPRTFDVPVNVLDITLARRVMGWSPEFSLRAGLERTWNWVHRLEADGALSAAPEIAGAAGPPDAGGRT